jgi:hypothetical protein
MKLKIVSDGTPTGTRVEDETGNRIENVTSIDWWIGVDFVARCKIGFTMTELEVDGDVIETTQLGDSYRSFKAKEEPEDHDNQG